MGKYRLIAFDMDGTLLNSEKKISKVTLEAMREALNMDKYITISTGRNMVELESILSSTKEIRYVICVSGALVKDMVNKKNIFTSTINRDIVLNIFKRIREYDCMVHIHSDKSIVQKDKEAHIEEYNMGQYKAMFDSLSTMADNIEDYFINENPPVYKFNLYCRDKAQREELKNLLSDLPITMAYAEEGSLECSALGTSKASGLQALCDYLDVDISETIAVGDAENDIEILKAAGLSVAMANSKKPVFQYADVTVAGNDEDGCAEAIYKYLLGTEEY